MRKPMRNFAGVVDVFHLMVTTYSAWDFAVSYDRFTPGECSHPVDVYRVGKDLHDVVLPFYVAGVNSTVRVPSRLGIRIEGRTLHLGGWKGPEHRLHLIGRSMTWEERIRAVIGTVPKEGGTDEADAL